MVVESGSDWLVTQIELLKALHGYVKDGVDYKVRSIDYVAGGDIHGKKLLRVITNQNSDVSRAFTDTVRATIEFLKDEDYDEAVILAEEFTQGATNLLRNESDLDFISRRVEHHYSISELLEAIQKYSIELCKLRCGKVPESEKDCHGYRDREYSCSIRRISDDADFHAERRWLQLLINDFSRLIKIRREMRK
jgi:hypothetical protein